MTDFHNPRTEVSRGQVVMKCVLFQQPHAMHVLNKKGSDKGLFESSSGWSQWKHVHADSQRQWAVCQNKYDEGQRKHNIKEL